MKEGKPRGESGIDFLERQRIKINERRRRTLGASPDGYLLYPERDIEITAHRALELAKEVLQAHAQLGGREDSKRRNQLRYEQRST